MPWYKWVPDTPFSDNRNGRVVESGDVVELTERVAAPNPGFVEVEAPEEESRPEGSDGKDGVVDPSEYSVNELKDEVSLSELSDEERKDMIALEEANKNRSSAIEWLEP